VTSTPLFVGVDVGTTSAKAVVTDDAGAILGEHQANYDVSTPRPMWAEQWPTVWLDGMSTAVRGALGGCGLDPRRVAAMAVSSLYGGSGVPVGDDLEPIGPALIWLDRRARKQADRLRQSVPLDRLVEITGNGVDSYYGFTKILWLQEEEPDIWLRTRWLVPPNALLVQHLTGELAVDHSAAGNIGGVYDIRSHAWSDEACELVGIDRRRLPEPLVASHDVVGRLHHRGAELTGLLAGTPVCAGGVDAAAATLSAGVLDQGRHVAMIGTSMCWGFVHERPPREAGLVSMPYVLDPERLTYTFGGAATAGAVPRWFVQHLAGGDADDSGAYAALDREAAQVPAGSDGLLVLPYFMGERSPIWDPDARGTVTGLTLYHTRAHLYRACLEGVAFALRHNVDAGQNAGYPLEEVMHVVGGAARSQVWLEILAAVVGMPVVATTGGEAAYGDAMLAAVGVGAVVPDELARWAPDADYRHRVEPRAATREVYDRVYPHYLGLYADLRQRFARLAQRG
jgi:xylulokinase